MISGVEIGGEELATPIVQPTTVTAPELLASSEFRGLVTRRWRVSLILTAALFIEYYGFILLVATDRALLATRVGGTTTLGILAGVAVILVSWGLTAVYVVWANRHYDPEVQRLRDRLRGEPSARQGRGR